MPYDKFISAFLLAAIVNLLALPLRRAWTISLPLNEMIHAYFV
jgi:hypothetical protein